MQPPRRVLLDHERRALLARNLSFGLGGDAELSLGPVGFQPRHLACFPDLPSRRGALAVMAILARRWAAAIGLSAAAQGIHQVDHIAGLWLVQRRRRLAGALGLDQRIQRILVAILELVGIEMALLGLQDMG